MAESYTCEELCPNGFYGDSTTSKYFIISFNWINVLKDTCLACGTACWECKSSPTYCHSCNVGYFLDLVVNKNTCT
jgi:hypothetical protein